MKRPEHRPEAIPPSREPSRTSPTETRSAGPNQIKAADATPAASGHVRGTSRDSRTTEAEGAAVPVAQCTAGPGPFDALPWQAPAAKPNGPASPLAALLGMLGHSDHCIGLSRAGRIATCSCETKPMDDPAVAVGLALHHARIAMTRGIPIPATVLRLLADRVEEGNATCIMVARWLDGSGLADLWRKPSDRSRRLN